VLESKLPLSGLDTVPDIDAVTVMGLSEIVTLTMLGADVRVAAALTMRTPPGE